MGTAVGEGPTAIDAIGVTVGLGAIVGVAAIVGVTMGDVGVSLGAGEGVADGDAVVVGTGVAEVTQPETAMAIRSPVSRGPVACNFVRRWRLLVCRSKETRPSLIHRALSNGPPLPKADLRRRQQIGPGADVPASGRVSKGAPGSRPGALLIGRPAAPQYAPSSCRRSSSMPR